LSTPRVSSDERRKPRHVTTENARKAGPVHDLVVALDVGGTNARARIATATGEGEPIPATADIATRVASATDLYEFVSRVVQEAERHGTVSAASVAVAGPAAGGFNRLTNWPSDSAIGLTELEQAGLPAGHTRLINDVVAGVWGVHVRTRAGGHGADLQQLLAAGDGGCRPGAGNFVYLAPGTGLGAAALIRHGFGPLGASAVACEAQHTQVPRFGGETGRVVDALTAALNRVPTWEDLVSGRGLVHIYDALCSIAAGEPRATVGGDAHRALAVAEAARTGEDALAVAAIDVFYRTLGRFAQMMALAFLPCAAVVIGGASTEHNLEHLRRGGFMRTFTDHHAFAALLGEIPVCTVGGDVNLEGGVWLAAHRSSGI